MKRLVLKECWVLGEASDICGNCYLPVWKSRKDLVKKVGGGNLNSGLGCFIGWVG